MPGLLEMLKAYQEKYQGGNKSLPNPSRVVRVIRPLATRRVLLSSPQIPKALVGLGNLK